MIGARLHNVVGRRKIRLGCTIGMAVCLSIVAGTASGYVQTGEAGIECFHRLHLHLWTDLCLRLYFDATNLP